MEISEDDTGNYLVSFVDVLGFSRLIGNNKQFPDLKKVYDSFDRILHYLPEVHRTGKQNKYYMVYSGTPGKLPDYADEILKNSYNFSDSIIFFIKTSKNVEQYVKQLSAICWITNAFIVESLIKDSKVFQLPIRGAIAYGPAYMDSTKKIHIGQPIIDAFQLSESLDGIGGAVHHSVRIPESFRDQHIGYNKQIVKYDKIPIKTSYKDKKFIKYALNWVQQHPAGEHWFPEMKGRKSRPLLKDITYHIEQHNWGENIEKKKNTVKFVEKICSDYDLMDGHNSQNLRG